VSGERLAVSLKLTASRLSLTTNFMLPKRLSRKTIYKSQWINLHVDRVKMPSGKIIEEYHFIDLLTDGVVALMMNLKKEICLVKAYRYQTQKIAWEL